MNNLLNLSPVETFFVLALQLWVTVIFPLLVLRKLSYVTSLLEMLSENAAPSSDDETGAGETE